MGGMNQEGLWEGGCQVVDLNVFGGGTMQFLTLLLSLILHTRFLRDGAEMSYIRILTKGFSPIPKSPAANIIALMFTRSND